MDVDGTLLPRKDKSIHNLVCKWILKSQKEFKIHLCSNNPSKRRIKSIAKNFNIQYTHRAGKPRRKKLKAIIQNLCLNNSEIAIIGDRIFTDILAGNRLGIYTILVNPIDSNGQNKNNDILHKIEKNIGVFLEAVQK